MSNTILKKCLTELNEKEPRLDYIKGAIETLIELQETRPDSLVAERPALIGGGVGSIPAQVARQDDEAAILDGMARAKLEEVKRMSNNNG